jgi:hypothetical protein
MGNAVVVGVVDALDAESQIVLMWRREQFGQLGFDSIDARLLAESSADLGQARRLRRAGCPLDLAFRILV